MKQLFIHHNSTQYEFRHYSRTDVIQVIKADLVTYELRKRGRLYFCSCPGGKFHGKCWHRGYVNDLLKQGDINEPWAEWAEEAMEMKDDKNNSQK